ncbi:hypothetical protein A7P55_07910 [Acinetobacter sp. Ac_5812]|nr:hypothetical protein [Acinetobacter sp. Ac_5812]
MVTVKSLLRAQTMGFYFVILNNFALSFNLKLQAHPSSSTFHTLSCIVNSGLYTIKKPTQMSGLPLYSFALNEGYCCLVIMKQHCEYSKKCDVNQQIYAYFKKILKLIYIMSDCSSA